MENWKRDRGHWGKEEMLYCACTDSMDPCPNLSPENKGVSPSIPLEAGYRGKKKKKAKQKKQSLTHIRLYAIL
jgi:hypothetical protein